MLDIFMDNSKQKTQTMKIIKETINMILFVIIIVACITIEQNYRRAKRMVWRIITVAGMFSA